MSNGRKIDQMGIKYIHQHLPFQHPTKFTQIGIFGLKIYHLATLVQSQIALFFIGLNVDAFYTSQ
jgi:hypothetical protein